MLKLICITSLVALSAGCATKHPEMSREEWINLTHRNYKNVTVDEALNGAETLLKWVDNKDFKFSHSDTELRAHRYWGQYIIIAATVGNDYWLVKASPIETGVRVSVQTSVQTQGITPAPTSGGDWSAGTGPLAGNIVQGTALYTVFWERLDYILKKSSNWSTCADTKLRKKTGEIWGDTQPLCDFFNTVNFNPTTNTIEYDGSKTTGS